MIKSMEEFLEAAKPLIEWLRVNGHTHMVAIVDVDGVVLNETLFGVPHPMSYE